LVKQIFLPLALQDSNRWVLCAYLEGNYAKSIMAKAKEHLGFEFAMVLVSNHFFFMLESKI
jgi:hypothetical protein